MGTYRRGTPFERMWNKFLVGDGCWDWTAGVDADGYGRIGIWENGRSTSRRAFKLLWEMFNGPVPDGLELDHLCRRPICIRPGHLEPVTHEENCRRKEPYQLQKTHCPQGHPYSGDNLYVPPSGKGRSCRICMRARAAAYEERRPSRQKKARRSHRAQDS